MVDHIAKPSVPCAQLQQSSFVVVQRGDDGSRVGVQRHQLAVRDVEQRVVEPDTEVAQRHGHLNECTNIQYSLVTVQRIFVHATTVGECA